MQCNMLHYLDAMEYATVHSMYMVTILYARLHWSFQNKVRSDG